MIEKIAKTIYISEELYERACAWEELSEGDKYKYKRQAKAAIEAIREPTEKMYNATQIRKGNRIMWQQMIDAALKEE